MQVATFNDRAARLLKLPYGSGGYCAVFDDGFALPIGVCVEMLMGET